MTNTKSGKRPWLGAVLAFFLPGLGHVYLREWLRSLMWFGFLLSAVVLFVPIPDSAIAATETGGLQAAWDAAKQVSRDLPMEAMIPILVVRVFSAIDAYWLALQSRTAEQEGERCPACGKPVDEELDFCQWCTTPLADHENHDRAEKGLLSR